MRQSECTYQPHDVSCHVALDQFQILAWVRVDAGGGVTWPRSAPRFGFFAESRETFFLSELRIREERDVQLDIRDLLTSL